MRRERCIAGPYQDGDGAAQEVLHRLLRQVLWRNTKAKVERELEVPMQEERVVTLRFSAIERYYYNQQATEVPAWLKSFGATRQ